MINKEEVFRDIASFADDENDVLIERDTIIFNRLGNTISFRLMEQDERLYVEYNGVNMPYTLFLAKEIAKLDVLAGRLIEASCSEIYIDTDAALLRALGSCNEATGLNALKMECDKPLWSGTRICFVTADAGHGKTVLLREFQRQIAKNYLDGKSKYLFLHIDLHGRDLVRLNEAIMFDLGELRFSGLYYASIITLMRHNLLVLGIDGFDELAAEVGGETALGSLTSLIAKMKGRGVLIAASRRTFFNTQDYLKRTRLLNKKVVLEGEFDEIKIVNWKQKQGEQYLEYYYNTDDAKQSYEALVDLLHTSAHPLLERPYLFTKMVDMAVKEKITPDQFLRTTNGDVVGINGVIDAFVRREVDKWKDTDKETGKPYLSFEQHTRLLAEVAREMWSTQRDIISVDVIQFVLTILFDEWHIEERLKPMVIRMAESHALLIPVAGKDNFRKFDHDEFKSYFLAKAVGQTIRDALSNNNFNALKSFLYIAQLSNTVAQYLNKCVAKEEIPSMLDKLKEIVANEWKPTFLQLNVGTLVPYLLDEYELETPIVVGPKLTFTSLIFENKKLKNIVFDGCSFLNVSFKNTVLFNVKFKNCVFTDIRIIKSGNQFNNVLFADTWDINMMSFINEDDDVDTEYSPNEIISKLQQQGFEFQKNADGSKIHIENRNSEFKKYVKRFLNKFLKTTYQYETAIREEPTLNFGKPAVIFEEIIPLLLKYNIIEEKNNKRTAQASSRAWILKEYSLSEIFKAEEDPSSPLCGFWQEINGHQ